MVYFKSWLLSFGLVLFIIALVKSKSTRPPPWSLPHGQGKFEGDIILDSNLLNLAEVPGAEGEKGTEMGGEHARNIIKGQLYLWPGGVVPYVIDYTFDSYPSERQVIQNAIVKLHSYACVRFVQRTSDQYYIRFIRGVGCSSYVGNLQISGQPVSIGQGCAKIGTVLHEMLHALGFFHTTSRHDRDSYVIVYPKNILSGYEHNFWKYRQDHVDNLGSPYDKQSIMQPPRLAWSKNGQSTVQSRRMPSDTLGRTDDALSDIDIGQLNALYKCTNKQNCFKWLGMEDGRITDAQLTASSYLSYYEPHQARLHLGATAKGNGAWCASQNYAQGEWLQIDLGSTKEVRGIATQGKVDFFSSAWVSHFTFQYSIHGNYWTEYSNIWTYGLSANFDENSVQYNSLPHKVSARFLRIIPIHWYNEMCLRVEVYGC